MELISRELERPTAPHKQLTASNFRAEPLTRLSTDWTSVARDWDNRKTALTHEWSLLTDEDVEGINGNRRTLMERLQARYGWTSEESTMQIDAWLNHGGKRHFR